MFTAHSMTYIFLYKAWKHSIRMFRLWPHCYYLEPTAAQSKSQVRVYFNHSNDVMHGLGIKEQKLKAVGRKKKRRRNYKINNLKYQISNFGQWLIWVTLRKHEEGQGSRCNGWKAQSRNLGPSTRTITNWGLAADGLRARHSWRCRSTRQNVPPCDFTVGELFSGASQSFGKNQPRCQLWWQLHAARRATSGAQKGKKLEKNSLLLPPVETIFFFPPHIKCAYSNGSVTKAQSQKTQQSSFII